MKGFRSGFLKGLLGCLIVAALGLGAYAVCGLVGLTRDKGPSETVSAEADGTGQDSQMEETHMSAETESEGDSEEGQTNENAGQQEEEEPQSIRMLFAGDLLITEYFQNSYDKTGVTAVVTEELRQQLCSADLFILNQEFPFGTTGEQAPDKQYTFRVPPQYVSMEKELGVDLVTLANNHILDFGREPLPETFGALSEAGIAYMGAGMNLAEASACRTFTIQDQTIGFLAASRVIPVASWNAGSKTSGVFTTYDPTRLVEEIAKAKEICDFVVVYVHWGIERNTTPEEYQRNLAYAYIDAGADAVIGSHPHVLQGVEYYQGKPIFYSLGNFIFNSRTYDTMVVELTLEAGECRVRILPCISSGGQVRLLEDASAFYENMRALSFEVEITEDGIVKN